MTTFAVAAAATLVTNLPPILVEASRVDSSCLDIPSSVRVITAEEISDSGAHSAVDLLSRQSSELHLRRSGASNPALCEIALRGYGELGHGRTLVLVDGERLNSPDMNAPNLARIALGAVDRIELLKGPQSVLQGDGASAGVINVVTEPRGYSRKSYLEVHGGSWGTIGAALGTRGGFAEEGVKYWADGAWDHSDGYRDNSSFDIWNLTGGVKKEGEGASLRLSASFNDSCSDLPGYLTYAEARHAPRRSHALEDWLHRTSESATATARLELDDENELKLSAGFSQRHMRAYQRTATWNSDNVYDILSPQLRGEWINTSEMFGLDSEFLLGVQYAYDRLDGTQRSGAGRQSPRYDRHLADGYLQERLYLVDDLSLELGGRLSRVWSHNSLCARPSRADQIFALDLGLVWNPTESSKLFLRASRFYRTPFLDEVPGQFDSQYNWVNTRLLKPETGWTVEAGFNCELEKEWFVGGELFYSRTRDEIFYDAVHQNNVNYEDETLRCGAGLRGGWERRKCAGVSLSASYAHAAFAGGDFGHRVLPMVPEATVAATARVWLWDECQIFGGSRYQSEMFSCSDFNNQGAALDGFVLFHVGAVYEPTFAAWVRGFKVSLTVDNLFDARFCEYATYGVNYWPGAGRSFIFSIRYEW